MQRAGARAAIAGTRTLPQETWAPVVRAAIDEYLSRKHATRPLAVRAAPLKPLIIRHAEQRGLVFPPEGYNYLKFIDSGCIGGEG